MKNYTLPKQLHKLNQNAWIRTRYISMYLPLKCLSIYIYIGRVCLYLLPISLIKYLIWTFPDQSRRYEARRVTKSAGRLQSIWKDRQCVLHQQGGFEDGQLRLLLRFHVHRSQRWKQQAGGVFQRSPVLCRCVCGPRWLHRICIVEKEMDC